LEKKEKKTRQQESSETKRGRGLLRQRKKKRALSPELGKKEEVPAKGDERGNSLPKKGRQHCIEDTVTKKTPGEERGGGRQPLEPELSGEKKRGR